MELFSIRIRRTFQLVSTIKALHNERQLLRDKINELEARYTSLSDDIL